MSRRNRMERLSGLTEGLIGRLDRTGQGAARAKVVGAWREAAGAEVFEHARGFTFHAGELVVFVDSAVWANELSVLSERYRSAINERIGKEAVTSIRFNVSRKVSEERVRDIEDMAAEVDRQADRAVPVPATETEIEQIRLMAATVPRERLREAVIAAAVARLEWRKGIEARNAAQRGVQGLTDGDSEPIS